MWEFCYLVQEIIQVSFSFCDFVFVIFVHVIFLGNRWDKTSWPSLAQGCSHSMKFAKSSRYTDLTIFIITLNDIDRVFGKG